MLTVTGTLYTVDVWYQFN